MNKGKVKIGFGLTNNGRWSCEQVKVKILEYISDADAEVNVGNNIFNKDFFVDILVNRSWADHLNFAEFMEWCQFNIVEGRPFIHGFHTESSKDGYKITFETTSVEEYDKVQAFIREKIIDKDKQTMLFHCSCGCNFNVKEPAFVGTLLVHETRCPACNALCRKAIEEY